MTESLLVLCLAAFAIVAALVSSVLGATLPWLDRLALLLAPRHRVRLWLGLAALPGAIAVIAVLVSFLPAVGIGHDHCLAHGPHHPHLCPHHAGGAPGIILVVVAALVTLRALHVGVRLARALRTSQVTSRALAQASEARDGVLVFTSSEPQAFVLGALRPRVHVSHGLFALGDGVVEPVLAHERAHARHRDLLWRALCPLLATGHLPSVASSIRARLSTAQEMAADGEAAETLPDGRVRTAEALLRLARLERSPARGLSFTHGDLDARVRELLDPVSPGGVWPLRLLIGASLAAPIAVGLSHDLIHHGIETLLGALS